MTQNADYGDRERLRQRLDELSILMDAPDPDVEVIDEYQQVYDALAAALCVCGHDRQTHWHDSHSCMASTTEETWACACDEFRPLSPNASSGADS